MWEILININAAMSKVHLTQWFQKMNVFTKGFLADDVESHHDISDDVKMLGSIVKTLLHAVTQGRIPKNQI